VKDDLRIENLAILCPNCHAFTDNYRGKNIGMSAQEETLDVEAG
jgi:predicted HNH restriction endonuclease